MGMRNSVDFLFKNKDYKKVLVILNKYTSNPNNKLDSDILKKYIYSLINLGYFDIAHKHIDRASKYYKDDFTNKELSSLYIQTNDFEKAIDIIENNNFTDEEYFDLARRFYQTGNYNEAYRYFSLLKTFSNNYEIISSSNGFISKIENYEQNGEFIKISYPYSMIHNKPQSIIKVENSIDNKEGLYLVWKKVGSKLYTFKLTDNIKQESYISKKKYKNLESNMTTIPRIVEIDNNDVKEIIDQISNRDFQKIINNTYKRLMIVGSQKDKSLSSNFIYDYRRKLNIEKNDIITVYDKESASLKEYFITGIKDKKSYYNVTEVIEKKGIYILKDNIKQRIKFSSRIISNKKLVPEEKERMARECENLIVFTTETPKKKKVKVKKVGDHYDS